MRGLVIVAAVVLGCGGSSGLSADECRDLDAAYAGITLDSDPSEEARAEADRIHDEWRAGGCDQMTYESAP